MSLGARLGEKVPTDCSGEEFDRSTRLWLLKFAQIAAAAPFTSVPIDDHSWSSMGFKGLTLAKIEEDELNPDAIPSDMHGIAVLIEKKDLSVLVPIASDLDEDAAEIFGKLVEAKVADFVDFAGFLDFAEGTDAFTPEEEVRAFDLSVDPRSAPQENGEAPPLAGGPLLETEIRGRRLSTSLNLHHIRSVWRCYCASLQPGISQGRFHRASKPAIFRSSVKSCLRQRFSGPSGTMRRRLTAIGRCSRHS